MSTRQEGIKSKDSTCDSEHGPDDEQADARRHDAAGRQGRAGDAAAAPPGRGGQFNRKFLDFLLWLAIPFRLCLSGEYFQLNWLPDRREGLLLKLITPLDVPHAWDG